MKGRGIVNHSSRFFHCLIWLLIFTFFLPTPVLMTAQAGENPANAHVMRRFNSPERARAIEEAARQDAAARAAYAEQEATRAPVAEGVTPAKEAPTVAPSATAAAGQRPADAFRPKTLTEVLFNQGAAFMGVPGLAPQQDKYGNFDEGLGFHQDGTVRRAGGADSASGYGGKRAASYATYGMTGGLGYGPGNMQGIGYGPYGNGLYDAMHQELWGRDDPTRGGRVTHGMGRSMDNFDPMDAAMQRGLNYGLGFLNSAGESALSGLVDGGRARLNFSVDWDGRINGEGDVLLPFWDSQYTTIYTQLGARSMSGMQHGGSDGEGADRWIGNAGIGQRWFPYAESLTDAGNLMLGYNAFFDYDFTRSHQRGGFGVEAQYDWLRLASNYYFPISSWRDSKDFDGDFVKERAAEGWDVRVKGYMPFYRNLAVTGAYSQWYGDHVGMFSSSKLEKDPKVWSYGLEYTPVPLVSGFVNQRSTENGRSDTEFGLRFTYHFQMPWEDQISHAKVAELRTVSGSKHEFVDRENRIILEYKAKNSYRIEYLGSVGVNAFKFRILDGFGKHKSGQSVIVRAGGGVTLAEAPAEPKSYFAQAIDFLDGLISVSTAHAADFSQTYVSDGNGEFIVRLDNVTAVPVVLTVQAGNNSQTFTLGEAMLSSGLFAASSTLANGAATALTLKTPNPGAAVTWSVVSGPGILTSPSGTTDGSGNATNTLTANATGSGPIVVRATANGVDYDCTVTIGVAYALSLAAGTANPTASGSSIMTATVLQNGVATSGQNVVFTWKVKGGSLGQQTGATTGTNASGEAAYTLAGNGDQRTITVTATLQSDSSKTATADVVFGAALPSGFIALAGNTMNWGDAGSYCSDQGGKLPLINNTTSWNGSGMSSLDGFGTGSWPVGLPSYDYWTGTEEAANYAWFVVGGNVNVFVSPISQSYSNNRVVCVPVP